MSELMNTAATYKAMSVEDKAVLQELKAYASEKAGRAVSLAEIIASVTPGMETPKDLRGV
jgi:hypothetical protein